MDELFEKLINDRLSPAELKTLRERFNAASDEELASLFHSGDIGNSDPEDVSQHLIDETKSDIDRRLFGDSGRKRVDTFSRFTRIAAAVMLPLILVGAIWLYISGISQPDAGICTLTTAEDETSSLLLSDGTSVKINGNSSLTFPSGFKKDRREVAFNGEAYFEVAKNPEAPFTITTSTMTVSVKGTAFNLMSRPGAQYSELSLDNGSVSVTRNNSGKTIDITSGNKLIVDNATGAMTVIPVDTPRQTSSWTSMEIYFDNATPEYLIDRIEQTYHTTLDTVLKKSIDENFTGTLPSDDLNEALRILRRIYSK